MSRQTTDQLYIDLEYYQPEEYLVYIAEARVDSGFYIDSGYIDDDYYEGQSIFASLTCDLTLVVGEVKEFEADLTAEFISVQAPEKIVGFAAGLNSQFTIPLAMLSDISGVDLFAFAEASIAIAVDRIRDNNSLLASDFDIATDFVRIIQSDADIDAVFTQATSPERSRDFDSELEAAVSVDVSETRIKDYNSNLTSEFNVFAVFSNTRGVDIVQQNFASLDCSAEKTVSPEVVLVTETNISVLGGKLKIILATLVSTASLLATVPRFRYEFRNAAGISGFANASDPARLGAAIVNTDFVFGGGSLFLPRTLTSGDIRGATGIYGFNLPDNHATLPSSTLSTSDWEISFWIKRTGPSGNSSLGGGTLLRPMIWGSEFFGTPLLSTTTNTTVQFWAIDQNLNFWYKDGTSNTPPQVRQPSGTINWTQWNFVRISKFRLGDLVPRRTSIQINGVSVLSVNDTHGANLAPNSNIIALASMAGQDIWVDDFRIRVGPFNQSTLGTVPTQELPYITNTNTTELSRVRAQLTFNSTFNDEQGIFLLQSTLAQLNVVAGLTATLSGPVDASAQLVAAAATTIQASVDRGADLEAFALGTLTADVTRIQESDVVLESQASVAAEFGITKQGDIVADSVTDVDAEVNVIVDVTADFASVASKLAIVVKVGDVVVDMPTVTDIDVDVVKVTDIISSLEGNFDQTTGSERIRDNDVVADAEFGQLVNVGIIFNQTVQTDSETFLTADSTITADADIGLSSEFTAQIDASGGVVRAVVGLESNSELDVEGEVTRDVPAALVSIATADITAEKITDVLAAAVSDTEVNIDYIRFRSADIATDAVATKVIVAVKNITQDIEGQAEFTSDVTVEKITDIVPALESTASVDADVVVIAAAEIATDSEFSISAEGTTNIVGEIHAFSEFGLEADIDVTVSIQLLAFSEASVDIDVSVIRDIDVVASGVFDINVQEQRIRLADSEQASEFNLTIDAEKLVDSGVLEFTSIASKLTLGRLVNLDMKVYVIPAETRRYIIAAETRNHRIDQETRIFPIRSTR
jgi:hypothetical protein